MDSSDVPSIGDELVDCDADAREEILGQVEASGNGEANNDIEEQVESVQDTQLESVVVVPAVTNLTGTETVVHGADEFVVVGTVQEGNTEESTSNTIEESQASPSVVGTTTVPTDEDNVQLEVVEGGARPDSSSNVAERGNDTTETGSASGRTREQRNPYARSSTTEGSSNENSSVCTGVSASGEGSIQNRRGATSSRSTQARALVVNPDLSRFFNFGINNSKYALSPLANFTLEQQMDIVDRLPPGLNWREGDEGMLTSIEPSDGDVTNVDLSGVSFTFRYVGVNENGAVNMNFRSWNV